MFVGSKVSENDVLKMMFSVESHDNLFSIIINFGSCVLAFLIITFAIIFCLGSKRKVGIQDELIVAFGPIKNQAR